MSQDEIDSLKRMLDQMVIPLNAYYSDEALSDESIRLDAQFCVRLLKYTRKAVATLEGKA